MRKKRFYGKIDYRNYCPKSQLYTVKHEIAHSKFLSIDAHTHFGARKKGQAIEGLYDIEYEVTELKKIGIVHCIDLTLFDRKNWEQTQEKVKRYKSYFSFCAPIDFTYYEEDHNLYRILDEMKRYKEEGAVGYKIWKNLGMEVKKADGSLLEICDQELEPIWDLALELDMPVVLHVADPPAFFEKADQYNERLEQLRVFPFWQHYGKEYTFEDLLRQLKDLLKRRKSNKFLVAHCCSWSSNLDFVDDMLEHFPNLYTDIAAVLAEIGRQPRRFSSLVQKFPKRILFGTDYFAGTPIWQVPYFRFLETEDEYFPYSVDDTLYHGRWNIYGCGLAESYLKKIYFENARDFFCLEL